MDLSKKSGSEPMTTAQGGFREELQTRRGEQGGKLFRQSKTNQLLRALGKERFKLGL